MSTCEARGWDTPTAWASATCVIGDFAAIRARAIAAVPGPHLRTGRFDEADDAINRGYKPSRLNARNTYRKAYFSKDLVSIHAFERLDDSTRVRSRRRETAGHIRCERGDSNAHVLADTRT